MKKNELLSKNFWRLCLVFYLIAGCSQNEQPNLSKDTQKDDPDWEYLLDENFSNFEQYLSFAHKNNYDGTPPKDNQGNLIEPIGLNPDGYDVFTIQKIEGEPVLRISGEYYGGLTTRKTYRNYHLRLKFKWGEKIHVPRLTKLKDSGILYHAQGPHGAEYWRSWKLSQEFQIMQGHLGDYWNQASSAIDVRAYPREYIMSPIADERRDFLSVGEAQTEKGYVMRSKNMEIENDWNLLELITYEGNSLHIVNGEVVMVLANSRYYENNIEKPLIEGQIQIQSEAAELFVKDMAIKPLGVLPSEYNSFFEIR